MSTAGPRTWDAIDPRRTGRRGALVRRAGMLALAAVVIAGAFGTWGVRTATAVGSDDGLHLRVDHPRVARPGLDVTFRVSVSDPAGLPAEVEVGLDAAYLHLFEAQAIQPEPESQSRRGDQVVLTFAPEPGTTTLVVELDHYVQPTAQRGTDAHVMAATPDGRSVVVAPSPSASPPDPSVPQEPRWTS
ncbi:MAG TPA: hypothetical protein VGE77_13205 [Nocardioides sp.]